jgi:hypothetical protein
MKVIENNGEQGKFGNPLFMKEINYVTSWQIRKLIDLNSFSNFQIFRFSN